MTINDNVQWQTLVDQEGECELAVALNNKGIPTHAKFWVNEASGSPQSNDETYYGEAWAQNTLRSWDAVPGRVLVINTKTVEQDESGAIIAPIEILWRTRLETFINCKQPIQPLSLVNAMSSWIANEFNWDDNPPLSIFTSTAQVGNRQYCKMYRSPDETDFAVVTGESTLPTCRTPLVLEDIEPLLEFVEDALKDAQRDEKTSEKLEALRILQDIYSAIAKAQEVPLEQVCRQRSKHGFRIVPDDFNALNEDDD